MTNQPPPNTPLPFEKALARLEKILDKLNSGEVALDEAIQLYGEAHSLIGQCTHSLDQAEQKVSQLSKKQNGTIALDQEGNPLTEEFPPSTTKE